MKFPLPFCRQWLVRERGDDRNLLDVEVINPEFPVNPRGLLLLAAVVTAVVLVGVDLQPPVLAHRRPPTCSQATCTPGLTAEMKRREVPQRVRTIPP